MREDVDYLIRKVGDHAQLTLTLNIYPRNLLLWALTPMIRPRIERNFRANVGRFEQIVNAAGPRQVVGAH